MIVENNPNKQKKNSESNRNQFLSLIDNWIYGI